MFTLHLRAAAVCLATTLTVVPYARAQWAVIDVPAIVQLVQEVQTMQQQLATAREQLQSARQALQSTTGGRGMERLLGGNVRNYLPTNWSQVTAMGRGQGPAEYAALSSDVQRTVAANAVLSAQRLAALSPEDQQQIRAARRWSAVQQVLMQQALVTTSNRFGAMQSLIAAISTAGDQKAILDLQARISAELGMLQNEQTKLQVLYHAAQAQESTMRQAAVEREIAGQGRFETRFRPVP